MVILFFTSYLVRVYFVADLPLRQQASSTPCSRRSDWGRSPMRNTTFGTMVGYLTLSLPLVVLLQLFSLIFVDRTLVEAAHNLRCGRLRTVSRVVVPGGARVGLTDRPLFLLHPDLRRLRQPALSRRRRPPTLSILITDTTAVRPAVAARRRRSARDDRDTARDRLRRVQFA